MKPFAHIRRMLPLVALTTAAVTATITTSAPGSHPPSNSASA